VLERAARLIGEHRDLLRERTGGDALAVRGWDGYLLALDDAALEGLERDAKWPRDAPASLRSLIDEAAAVCELPSFPAAPPSRLAIGETPRKRAQIDAFARVLEPLARGARRVVDVGCGHGHLTRELAARIDGPIVGLERDADLMTRARALGGASFAEVDVLCHGLGLERGDCAIGLHACGELGDAMVESAARAGASVALVGCCPQKRRSPSRRSLSCDLELPREVLGLGNLAAGDQGVEASRRENLGARERRLALHRLLVARVGALRFGAEIEGLNRRVAHASLDVLVERAFGRRGLALPTRVELEDAMRAARLEHARARRLSLPRATLARPLEVFLLLDRARHLEERGYAVEYGVLFPREVSARNLALLARK